MTLIILETEIDCFLSKSSVIAEPLGRKPFSWLIDHPKKLAYIYKAIAMRSEVIEKDIHFAEGLELEVKHKQSPSVQIRERMATFFN